MDASERPKTYELDITGEVCPMTFVKTKLLLERIQPGERMEVRLNGGEPIINVPRAVRELGHKILTMEQIDTTGGRETYRLVIEKA